MKKLLLLTIIVISLQACGQKDTAKSEIIFHNDTSSFLFRKSDSVFQLKPGTLTKLYTVAGDSVFVRKSFCDTCSGKWEVLMGDLDRALDEMIKYSSQIAAEKNRYRIKYHDALAVLNWLETSGQLKDPEAVEKAIERYKKDKQFEATQ